MTFVDAHTHASQYWFEPVESLLFHMDRNNVQHTVLTGVTGQTADRYNQYLIDCARAYPDRIAPVVMVDVSREDAPKVLKHWVGEGAQGVRLELDDRSPGNDPIAIWKACSDLGIAVSCQGHKKEEFADDAFRELISRLPRLTFIIEHLGKAKAADTPPYSAFCKTLELAQFPNVYLKVGGLGEICKRPFPFRDPFFSVDGVPPFVKMAYDAFGASRMMWGSNYPPCSHHEGYGNTFQLLDQHLDEFCNADDKAWIFGKTALSLFKFSSNNPTIKSIG